MAMAVRIEVAYALSERQQLIALDAAEGISIAEAIRQSGVLDAFPEIDLAQNKVGIFGRLATLETVLREGDRVEIYRPLIADPKEARKQRAAQGKEMKKRAR
jgi:putative ubiquitin-RnfH superfamily antitoxin RatB of RatAB toxin-antitoxin module